MTTQTGHRDIALVVPGEADYLYLVRDLVTAISRRMGFPDQRVGEIEIAVDEACANIIEHAYGGQAASQQVIEARCPESGPPSIALRVSVYRDRIEVRILDEGPDFSLGQIEDLDLSGFLTSDRRRGIGTYIIRNCVDEIHHRYTAGKGNELLLVKYLRGSSRG